MLVAAALLLCLGTLFAVALDEAAAHGDEDEATRQREAVARRRAQMHLVELDDVDWQWRA